MVSTRDTSARRVSMISAHLCASVSQYTGTRMTGPTLWSEWATLGGGSNLNGKTVLISGGSRGIGLCIAKKAARDGANVVICAKTTEPHPTLPGTIAEAVAEVRRLGGQALGYVVDVRNEGSIEEAVKEAVTAFGGIDVLINCASAIFPTETENIDLKRLNLMWEVTTRAPLLLAKHCVPHLKQSAAAGRHPHIITCSPPVDFTHWPAPKNPNYLVCKMGMSVGSMALAEELREFGVAANTLWPAGSIATSAINHLLGNDAEAIDEYFMTNARTPEIQADAAYAIITSDSRGFTGNMTIDEDVLFKAGHGVVDLAKYDYATLGGTRQERLANILRT